MKTPHFRLLAFSTLLIALPASLPAQVAPGDFSADNVSVFADKALTRLKPETTDAQIKAIKNPLLQKLAAALKAGKHDLRNRYKTHEAYEPVKTLARRLKTSDYSKFENPTGIHFAKDDQAVLWVEGAGKEKPELRVRDFGASGGKEKSYPLKDGLNIIKLEGGGLGYISYYTERFKTAPKIKVHVITGKVNGVFDSSVNKAEEWKGVLAGAVCDTLDIVGRRVHLVYPVDALRAFCPERGMDLINLYDRIIGIQWEMMGLIKYDRVPKNRMFGRVVWKGYMFADAIGAGFHNNTMKTVANPDTVLEKSWGVAHEFGHVNQARPGMKWNATTEVTNNLYSIWTQYLLHPAANRLEDEMKNDGDGNKVKGGWFNAYLNYAIIHGEQWHCQRGPGAMTNYENGGDLMVKLCPLWQLMLYFMVAKNEGTAEFLPDIFEIVRKMDDGKIAREMDDEKGLISGHYQLAFMRNVCDVNKLDMTDFFITTGMLKPIDKELKDYGLKRLTITQEDCDALVAHAKRYPKPASPVIHYISRRSVEAFRNKLPVQGTYNQGVTAEGAARIISHAVWKNALVFEAYKGDKLERITLVGTNYPEDNSATLVQFPEGCTRIEAVAWDGTRTLVHGKR